MLRGLGGTRGLGGEQRVDSHRGCCLRILRGALRESGAPQGLWEGLPP